MTTHVRNRPECPLSDGIACDIHGDTNGRPVREIRTGLRRYAFRTRSVGSRVGLPHGREGIVSNIFARRGFAWCRVAIDDARETHSAHELTIVDDGP
jgi:hypothetical protein